MKYVIMGFFSTHNASAAAEERSTVEILRLSLRLAGFVSVLPDATCFGGI